MVKNRLEITFAIVMALYFITRWIRPYVEIDFIQHHLTDLYFIPAACLFSLFFVRKLKQDDTIQVPIHYVVILVMLTAFYFEWYLPKYYGRPGWYTSDIVDALMYAIGGVVFILMQKLEKKYYFKE